MELLALRRVERVTLGFVITLSCIGVAFASPCRAQPAPSPQSQAVAPVVAPASDGGWALGGAVYGIAAGAATLGLATGSELTKDEQIPSLPIGIAATVLFASSVPIVAVSGMSARRDGAARGVRGLRIAGWIVYGLALADAFALLGMGVAEVEPPDGVIVSVGGLGTAALALMAADAWVSSNQARRPRHVAVSGPPREPRWLPTLSWSRGVVGTSVSAGLRTRF